MKEVRQLLGLVNYGNKYIKNYAQKMKQAADVLKIIKLLTTYSVSFLFDKELYTELHTDVNFEIFHRKGVKCHMQVNVVEMYSLK